VRRAGCLCGGEPGGARAATGGRVGRRCADRRGRDQLLLSEASIEFDSYTPIQIPVDFTGKY